MPSPRCGAAAAQQICEGSPPPLPIPLPPTATGTPTDGNLDGRRHEGAEGDGARGGSGCDPSSSATSSGSVVLPQKRLRSEDDQRCRDGGLLKAGGVRAGGSTGGVSRRSSSRGSDCSISSGSGSDSSGSSDLAGLVDELESSL